MHKALKNFTNLTKLDLCDNFHIQNILFVKKLCQLKTLLIHGCDNIVQSDFCISLPVLEPLECLDISECNVSKRAIQQIIPHLKKLKELNVRDCCSMKLSTVRDLAENLEQFQFCPLIVFDHIHEWKELIENFSQLLICPTSMEVITSFYPEFL